MGGRNAAFFYSRKEEEGKKKRPRKVVENRLFFVFSAAKKSFINLIFRLKWWFQTEQKCKKETLKNIKRKKGNEMRYVQ